MRCFTLIMLLFPLALCAQDAKRFARAVQQRTPHALDRWMRHELHTHRKGLRITQPGSSYVMHSSTYDNLVVWLRRQPGVQEAEWDRCLIKAEVWPGHSTIGLRICTEHLIAERCYSVQEGRMGTITLFGWRPHLRKSREELKWLGAQECVGFVEAQRKACVDVLP